MKIVTRAQLIEMPRGTLFAEASDPCNYGPLCVFGGEFGPDFTERSVTVCQSDGSEQYVERSQEMWETGASYPVNEDYGREGYFDDTLRYVVYEPADIESIFAEVRPAGVPREVTTIEELDALPSESVVMSGTTVAQIYRSARLDGSPWLEIHFAGSEEIGIRMSEISLPATVIHEPEGRS